MAEKTVVELRQMARDRGVSGTSGMRKDELVKAVAGAAAKRGAPAKRPEPAGKVTAGRVTAAKAAAGKEAAGKAPTRATGKAPTGKAPTTGKAATGKASISRAAKAGTTGRATTAKARTGTAGTATSRPSTGGARRGSSSSRSLKYAQEIRSVDDLPMRPGRSLVTTDHQVIQRWAQQREAAPATIPGTEHDGHVGVLRLDFPGYGGRQLQHISWDQWFDTFDLRGLNFIFQEKSSNGRPSNFFVLENPGREDG